MARIILRSPPRLPVAGRKAIGRSRIVMASADFAEETTKASQSCPLLINHFHQRLYHCFGEIKVKAGLLVKFRYR